MSYTSTDHIIEGYSIGKARRRAKDAANRAKQRAKDAANRAKQRARDEANRASQEANRVAKEAEAARQEANRIAKEAARKILINKEISKLFNTITNMGDIFTNITKSIATFK